jgi:hypothetical protein
MMGQEDSQVPIWSYRVNLDKRVRDDHPLRRINAAPLGKGIQWSVCQRVFPLSDRERDLEASLGPPEGHSLLKKLQNSIIARFM